MIERLAKNLDDYGVSLSSAALGGFENYLDKIMFFNKSAGLTAYKTENEIIDFMFRDSLAGGLCREFLRGRICDFGTGGGFPGLPLKLAFPELDVTLLDASRKKCDFLAQMIKTLKIDGCKVLCVHGDACLEKFDVILSRACKELPELISLTFPHLHSGGFLVAWKGPLWRKELKAAGANLKKYGGEFVKSAPYSINDMQAERAILIIKKN